jgi:hypothetical protein
MAGDAQNPTQNLAALRDRVRPLLNGRAPGDALCVYYALYHDPQRTQLFVHDDAGGVVDGFVAVCQTGQRLFEPTVVLRTPDSGNAPDLLRRALVPGRPYYLITTPDLRDAVLQVVRIEQPERNHVYRLDLARFTAPINVLVVAEQGVGGQPRFVIRSQGEIAAQAGVNWMSPFFAEVSVRTRQGAEGRGWGRAVVAACTRWVIRSGRQALYVVNELNAPSLAVARAVGFVDTGVREFAGEGVCKP